RAVVGRPGGRRLPQANRTRRREAGVSRSGGLMTEIDLRFTVNGEERAARVDRRSLLIEAVRDDFGLTGSHIGGRTGDCGACTMGGNGKIIKSCLELAVGAQGATIVTIEGLAEQGKLTRLQQSFWDEYGFQCGYCLPGMLFAARDLLARNPAPTEH